MCSIHNYTLETFIQVFLNSILWWIKWRGGSRTDWQDRVEKLKIVFFVWKLGFNPIQPTSVTHFNHLKGSVYLTKHDTKVPILKTRWLLLGSLQFYFFFLPSFPVPLSFAFSSLSFTKLLSFWEGGYREGWRVGGLDYIIPGGRV